MMGELLKQSNYEVDSTQPHSLKEVRAGAREQLSACYTRMKTTYTWEHDLCL